MAKQAIKNNQYQFRDTGAYRAAPYFKFGTKSQSFGGGGDYTIDTGVAKFPNGIIASSVSAGWPNASWSQESRGFNVPYNGGTNIEFAVHLESGAQTIDYKWWALGY